jgi:arylsulfatase A-like enzyme
MEVFAGYSENADWNVGRLLDAVEEMGDLDNTLIFYIWGDNGSSLEGTLTGSFNEMTFLNGVPIDAEQQLKLIDQYGGIDALGGDHTAPHFASAWAHACNTPFQWGKQMASHLGGSRDPMAVVWPNRVAGGGDLRTQFTHCIDIGPTVLEVAGIPEPASVDGIEQEPMDGTSFAYSFDDPEAAGRHTVQYFEFAGARAIYHDGWWAAYVRAGSPGTCLPRRCGSSRRGCTTRIRTRGSCTTCPTTSPRPTTSPPTSRTSSESCRNCSGRRQNEARCCP